MCRLVWLWAWCRHQNFDFVLCLAGSIFHRPSAWPWLPRRARIAKPCWQHRYAIRQSLNHVQSNQFYSLMGLHPRQRLARPTKSSMQRWPRTLTGILYVRQRPHAAKSSRSFSSFCKLRSRSGIRGTTSSSCWKPRLHLEVFSRRTYHSCPM